MPTQTVKPSYAAFAAMTVTGLNSLASAGNVFSNEIDNSTNLYDDALLAGVFITAASGVSATGTINIILAANDGNGNYPTNVADCPLLTVLTANSNSLTLRLNPASIAAAYGGRLPQKYKIGVINNSGAALASAGNSMTYQGVQDTIG